MSANRVYHGYRLEDGRLTINLPYGGPAKVPNQAYPVKAKGEMHLIKPWHKGKARFAPTIRQKDVWKTLQQSFKRRLIDEAYENQYLPRISEDLDEEPIEISWKSPIPPPPSFKPRKRQRSSTSEPCKRRRIRQYSSDGTGSLTLRFQSLNVS